MIQKDVRAVTNICRTIKHFKTIISTEVSHELVELFESTMVPEELQNKYNLKRLQMLKECPEVKAFIHILHLHNLIASNLLSEAFMFAKKAVSEIKELHRATLYYLNAQVYHLLARVAELNKKYAEVRTELFEGYTNAQIRVYQHNIFIFIIIQLYQL